MRIIGRMPCLELTPAARREHRAAAHHLQPVVMIGNDGLTDAVVEEADVALRAHGLIKIRAAGEDRASRDAQFAALADRLHAAPVQHIGKLFVLWRPRPEPEPAPREGGRAPRDVTIVKFSKSGHHRPQVKKVKVPGNQRLTAGGQIKRVRHARKSSPKKSMR
jgi:putative YhbY family RNA-binding protein